MCGNGTAGGLGEVVGAKMSVDLRCPACEDVALVLGVQERRARRRVARALRRRAVTRALRSNSVA
jgi:hypothetical protein